MEQIEITKPQVEIDQALKELLQVQEDRVTIVHCRYYFSQPHHARIWPTTYLIEEDGSRRKLLHAFNISLAPNWTLYFLFDDYVRFTLVFEGLSKGCNEFSLQEAITEPGAFYSDILKRNNSDVYKAEVHCKPY